MRVVVWIGKTVAAAAIGALIVLAINSIWAQGTEERWIARAVDVLQGAWLYVSAAAPTVLTVLLCAIYVAVAISVFWVPWAPYADDWVGFALAGTIGVPLSFLALSRAAGEFLFPVWLAVGIASALVAGWIAYPFTLRFRDRRDCRKAMERAAARKEAEEAEQRRIEQYDPKELAMRIAQLAAQRPTQMPTTTQRHDDALPAPGDHAFLRGRTERDPSS